MSTSSKLRHFRDVFGKSEGKELLQSWFPGHMHKGIVQMQKKLKSVDCILEVHDARIPFSGRNPRFYSMLFAIKPHILVLNKMDLADMTHKSIIRQNLHSQGVRNVLFTDSKANKKGGVTDIVPMAIDLIKNSTQYNRAGASDYCMMVIGIPNVGKSSLINRLRGQILRKGKATHVGAVPGITRSVLEKIKICDDPCIFLLDTPGVMQPHVKDFELGMRLALCCTLKDHIVGEELMADYLLFWLNKHQNFSYVDFLGIPEPTDDVNVLLCQVAAKLNRTKVHRSPIGSLITIPDYKFAAMHFVRAFREGTFGKVLLDDDLLKEKSQH